MKTFYDIADEQGWSDITRLVVVLRFVTEAGLQEELTRFAGEIAAYEQVEGRQPSRWGAKGWESGS